MLKNAVSGLPISAHLTVRISFLGFSFSLSPPACLSPVSELTVYAKKKTVLAPWKSSIQRALYFNHLLVHITAGGSKSCVSPVPYCIKGNVVSPNVTAEHRDKKNVSTCVYSYTIIDAVVLSIFVLRRLKSWEMREDLTQQRLT